MASLIDSFTPYSKFQAARGILHSVGSATPYPKYQPVGRGFRTVGSSSYSKYRMTHDGFRTIGAARMGDNDWGAFLDFNTDMASIFAPILGQYLGTQAIKTADSDTKIQALQTYLTGRTLQAAGKSTGTSSTVMQQLLNFANSLPAAQRTQYIQAACADLMSKTTDPSLRSALQAQCNALLKPSVWQQIKWPVIIGTVALGVASVVFVVKRKEFIWGPGGMGVRA